MRASFRVVDVVLAGLDICSLVMRMLLNLVLQMRYRTRFNANLLPVIGDRSRGALFAKQRGCAEASFQRLLHHMK